VYFFSNTKVLVNNGPRAAAVSLFVEDGQGNRLENSCTTEEPWC